MTSQVQAVLAERVAAISMFENGCRSKGVCSLPAVVATFAADCEVLGLEKLVEIVAAIANVHSSHGFADPTYGRVSAELGGIVRLEPPRAWPREHWQRFRSLPYELQVYLAGHEKRRETVVRRSQNEAAAARRELAELKSKEVT
jgi:hypothetical protein